MSGDFSSYVEIQSIRTGCSTKHNFFSHQNFLSKIPVYFHHFTFCVSEFYVHNPLSPALRKIGLLKMKSLSVSWHSKLCILFAIGSKKVQQGLIFTSFVIPIYKIAWTKFSHLRKIRLRSHPFLAFALRHFIRTILHSLDNILLHITSNHSSRLDRSFIFNKRYENRQHLFFPSCVVILFCRIVP